MLWEGVCLGIGTWPVCIGSFWLTWEFLNSYFNKGAYTSNRFQLKENAIYGIHFVMDTGLHIIFILYGLGRPTDDLSLDLEFHKIWYRAGSCIYLVALIVTWMIVFALCSRL